MNASLISTGRLAGFQRLLVAVVIVGLAAVIPALAGKGDKGKPTQGSDDIPVRVTLCPQAEQRTDLGIPAGYCSGVGITDDGQGNYIDGVDGVIAFLNPESLIMNPVQKGKNAAITDQRVISFDLSAAVGTPDAVPTSAANVRFRVTTTFCDIGQLTLGESDSDCHLNFRFLETGAQEIFDEWYLRFVDDGAGTGGVTATCIAEDVTVGCIAWTLETNPDHEAVLLMPDHTNSLIEVGRFTIPAKLLIERLP